MSDRLIYNNNPIPQAKLVFEDSWIVRNFLPNATSVYKKVNAAPMFLDRYNLNTRLRGRVLHREKCYLYKAPDGMITKYTFPGFQHGAMEYYCQFEDLPIVHQIVEDLCSKLLIDGNGVEITQVIVTRYVDGDDEIGYHSDKIKDIAPGSFIISLSLGETREFHIGRADPVDPKKTIFEQAFVAL